MDTASAIIQNALEQYGLSSIGNWAWQRYLATGSTDQVFIEMRQTPEYKQRFPAMEALSKAGRAISEASYVNYEQTLNQLLHTYGIPKGMYDTPDSIAKMLVNDVSAAEANDRLKIAASASITAPQEVKDALNSMYGVEPGHIVAFYLDPDRALPLIQQQYAAAEVSGAAARQRIAVDNAEAERLAAQGVTYNEAVQGFGAVASATGLETGVGETVSQRDLVGAQFGDAAAAAKVQRVGQGRVNQFRGDGQPAATQGGVVALGSAGTR